MQKATLVSGQPVRHPYITKTWKVMQLTGILFFALSLHVTANVNSQTVDFSGKNVPLKKVFAEVKRQTGFVFSYNADDLVTAKPVTVEARRLSLTDFLELVFSDQPLKYRVDNRAIIVSAKHLAEHLSTPLLSPPPITVRGRIVNEKGEPVIASVTIKGTNRGTTSNTNGEFELNNINSDAVLIISATNIETKVINVNHQAIISVLVKTVTSSLDEVVINKGYYTEKQRFSTGNVSKVTAKDIERQPIYNPLQAIQGRTTGAYVKQNSGVPGGSFSIQIRGQNSLRDIDANSPLYVIDGVPFPSQSLSAQFNAAGKADPLNAINPLNIESIQILKDADATAIYGSLGANGVVLITTKKPGAGKATVQLNITHGLGRVNRKLSLLSTSQYLTMRKEAFANDGVDYTDANVAYAPDLMNWDTTRYTDWQKELIGGTAKQSNAQLTLTGGNEQSRYSIGLNYYKETTVFPGDFSYQRGSAYISLNHFSANKKWQFEFVNNYSGDKNQLATQDLTPLAMSLPPNAPRIFDTEGNLNWQGNTWLNPLVYIKQTINNQTTNLVSNFATSYQITTGLSIKANLGYNVIKLDQQSLIPLSSKTPGSSLSGDNIYSSGKVNTWNIEPQIIYTKTLNRHAFSILAGTTFRETISTNLTINSTGFSSDATLQNRSAATSSVITVDNYAKYRYNGFFGRIGYNWNEKYIVNLTGRRDGSTKFGPDKKFGNFGAVGLGWIFSKENLLTHFSDIVSFGKITTSFGTTGNDRIGDYKFLQSYTTIPVDYQQITPLSPTRLGNPEYGWENVRKFEAGIDLGLFKNIINIKANYYNNKTSNQLVDYPLPIQTGFTSIVKNLPATIRNSGIEFEFRSSNLKSKLISWTTEFNITFPRNKLLAFPNISSSSYAVLYEVGQPLSILKAYHFTGLDKATGAYTYQDYDNSSYLSYNEDAKIFINTGQKYYGGFRNVLTVKGFEFDILFQFVKQVGANYFNLFRYPGQAGNQPDFIMQRWTANNRNTDIQAFSQTFGTASGLASYYLPYSEYAYSDASFIRLKNLFVSYELPAALINKGFVKGVRIYLQGQNLLTITRYKGLDPETAGLSLPPLRMTTVGLNVKL